MRKKAASPTNGKDDPEGAYGRRPTTLGRTSRDRLLSQFRQARRRLDPLGRR